MYIKDLFSLEGRVALVTGASAGMGYEMALAFARAGARVYVNGSHDGRAGDAAQRIRSEGLAAEAAAFDLGDLEAGAKAIERIDAENGRLDILVNNVGVRLREPIEETTTDRFGAMMDVNVTATYALTRAAAEIMKRHAYGRIILMGSSVVERAAKGNVAYIAAKGALTALGRSLACEYGGYGINCNVIAPGVFATETNAFVREPAFDAMMKRFPSERFAEPHEIAGTALYLASAASSYVNGATIAVDGGFTAAA